MIGIFESIVELIELRESLFEKPLIVLGLKLDIKEDGASLGLTFGVGWY